MIDLKKRGLAVAAAGTLAILGASAASAATLNYTITSSGEYTGSGATLSGPVAVTFDDMDTVGSVRLTVDLTSWDTSLSEYVAGFYFNTDVTALTYSIVAPDPSSDTSLVFGTDAYEPGGQGGAFDALAGFETSNSPSRSRFVAGEKFVVDLFGTGITISSFAGLSTVSKNGLGGEYPVVLRARSLNGGEGSGWFYGEPGDPGDFTPVPVPATLPLLAGGLGLAGFVLRRKQRKAA